MATVDVHQDQFLYHGRAVEQVDVIARRLRVIEFLRPRVRKFSIVYVGILESVLDPKVDIFAVERDSPRIAGRVNPVMFGIAQQQNTFDFGIFHRMLSVIDRSRGIRL